MRVTITDVDQRFSLESREFTNLLTVQLPSGQYFQVAVSDEVVKAVLAEASGTVAPGPAMGHPPAPSPVYHHPGVPPTTEVYTNGRARPAAPPPRAPEPEQQRAHESEEFEDLVDGDYETQGQLTIVNTPEAVTLVELETGPQPTPVGDWPERELKHHVASGEVDWETLPDTQLPPSVKAILRASQVQRMLTIEDLDKLKADIVTHMAQASKKPRAGQVNWDSGPRRQVESAARRSVPRDEAGNPIPPGGILEMPERDPGEIRDDDEGVQQA